MTESYIDDIKALGMNLLSTADQALYDAKKQGRDRAINAGLLALVEPVECPQ